MKTLTTKELKTYKGKTVKAIVRTHLHYAKGVEVTGVIRHCCNNENLGLGIDNGKAWNNFIYKIIEVIK